MKKKVLFVHDHKIYRSNGNLYSRGGLTKRKIDSYINHIGKLTICSRVLEGSYLNLNKISNGNVKHVEFPDVLRSKFSNLFKAISILIEEVRNNEIVIARLPSISGIIAALYLIISGRRKKLVVEVVGCAFDSYWYYGGLLGKFLAPIMFLLMRLVIKFSKNNIYVTSNYLQTKYPTYSGNKVSISDVEIDSNDIQEILEKRKNKINSNFDKICLGMIGNYNSKYKGFDTAFKALKRINSGIINYELRIIGGGEKKHLEDLAREFGVYDFVYFDGIKDHPVGVNRWLDDIDIYIHPSKLEGLPRSIIEAQSRGCCVIGSNVGGIPELLNSSNIIRNDTELSIRIIQVSNPNSLIEQAFDSLSRASSFFRVDLLKKQENFYNSIRLN